MSNILYSIYMFNFTIHIYKNRRRCFIYIAEFKKIWLIDIRYVLR